MRPRETILVVDDDSAVREGLLHLLDRAGRSVIACSDIESAELMIERTPVTHVIADVQFSNGFRFEGLHFIARVRTRLPHCRIVLITGNANGELRAAATSFGATALLTKPFTYAELSTALGSTDVEMPGDAPYTTASVPSIAQIIQDELIEIAYQPIVTLAGAETIAFEALARVRGGWPAGNISDLFDYAAQRHELARLNIATTVAAIQGTPVLPENASLFLNVDPPTFEVRALPGIIVETAQRAGFPLHRLVLEITERSAFRDPRVVVPQFEELRRHGVRFALDDHGSKYSHLALMNTVAPSFIKISQSFGTALEQDVTKTRIVAHIASLARDFGCRAIVEGVETEETARAAAELGVELAQGWHFGHPETARHWQDRSM